MGRPKKDTVQINFRIPSEWPDMFQKLAAEMSKERGIPLCKSDAMREAMAKGFRLLTLNTATRRRNRTR